MLLQVIVAVVSAIVFSGFYAGYTTENTAIYHLDVVTMAAFLIATLTTVVLSQLISSPSQGQSTTSNKKPKSPAPAKNKAKSSASQSSDREQGSVKWFNVSKGFGFITRDNGEDIFVHYRSIRGQGRRRLFEGQAVSFAVIDSDKGLQADDVEII